MVLIEYTTAINYINLTVLEFGNVQTHTPTKELLKKTMGISKISKLKNRYKAANFTYANPVVPFRFLLKVSNLLSSKCEFISYIKFRFFPWPGFTVACQLQLLTGGGGIPTRSWKKLHN